MIFLGSNKSFDKYRIGESGREWLGNDSSIWCYLFYVFYF